MGGCPLRIAIIIAILDWAVLMSCPWLAVARERRSVAGHTNLAAAGQAHECRTALQAHVVG